ncbi:MAG TPA: HoxN/HupN/NixA family nickel/cobalt transporter [Amycolatopsis sp.]|nr:HoxN/HupN/NixA family nickel/cobalt transporter [Amycolatopsis sp.]
MQRRDWYPIAAMTAFIVALNVVGWGVLAVFVVPAHYSLGASGVFGIGLGVTAFTLGMRHAFDADHIAAIDNTTRKLIAEGQRPLTVGFWFSLGHSTVVFGLCLLLSFGVRALLGQLGDDASVLHQVIGLIGVAVSGVFLCLIALFNLVVLGNILKVFRGVREGRFDEHELEAQLAKRGLLNRILGKATAAVRKPWHIYPVGVLFGLGFDTATEVGLLVLAGGTAAFALPWYAILVLPVLFAAGMTLFDAADGCLMNYAYDWASARPVRKIFYNIAITGLTVVVALLIGLVELVTALADRLGITSGPLAAIASLDLDYVGFVLVGLFLVTWAVSLLVWRVGRFEERWPAPAK